MTKIDGDDDNQVKAAEQEIRGKFSITFRNGEVQEEEGRFRPTP